MALLPAAIVLVNDDLVDNVRDHIAKQLHIDEIIDGYTLDNRVIADATYNATVKANNQRILVIRPFTNTNNRDQMDVVLFVKSALASVQKNNFGPPGKTFQVVNLYWGQICVF